MSHHIAQACLNLIVAQAGLKLQATLVPPNCKAYRSKAANPARGGNSEEGLRVRKRPLQGGIMKCRDPVVKPRSAFSSNGADESHRQCGEVLVGHRSEHQLDSERPCRPGSVQRECLLKHRKCTGGMQEISSQAVGDLQARLSSHSVWALLVDFSLTGPATLGS